MAGDAMTTERAREEVAEMLAFTQKYGREIVVTDDDADAVNERIAALTHAIAALDAVARVRALGAPLYAARVRLIADEHASVLSTGAVVTLHEVANRLADITRALNGEAAR